ncbi:hypothetical protein AVEN_118350-1 [Araneus ventricosus]|uniref:Uncharacterized protein n=1 Tax=Araneus ventricosus TaxID=182803 RepID=A0A4Y2B7Z0_ARAVE|nr:hypothetical protein AVEN_118350-1 [Araneus ventricosus]
MEEHLISVIYNCCFLKCAFLVLSGIGSRVCNPSSLRGLGGLVARCRARRRRVPNPIPLKIPSVLGLLHVKSYVGDQTFSCWCGAEVWRRGTRSGVVLVICPWFRITRSVAK